MKLAFIFPILFLASSAMAEYRVYQYYVRSVFPKAQDANAYLATSGLDPISYVAYHGGPSAIRVDLMRTWMCPGATGHTESVCPSPYEKLLSDTVRK